MENGLATVTARWYPPPVWTRVQRHGLRFLVSYFALYTPVLLSTLGFAGLPPYWYDGVWRSPVDLLGDVIGLSANQVSPSGMGDVEATGAPFQAAQAILLAILALGATIIWSRRTRENAADDRRVYLWFRIGLRYLLAYAAIHYAVIALLRFQFADLTPEHLITPTGQMRPAELLWAFLGWSWVFTTFLALTELASAVCLLRRTTTLLGALLLGVVLSNVVILNFAFDVAGKSLSPHLLAMVGLLALPDLKRLWQVHLLGEPASLVDAGDDVPGEGVMRRHQGKLKAAVVLLMVASPVYRVVHARGHLFASPPHPLAGLYAVTGFVRDSVTLVPLVGDTVRWNRVVITPKGDGLHVQLGDDTWLGSVVKIDTAQHHLAVAAVSPSEWRVPPADLYGGVVLSDTLVYTSLGDTLQLAGMLGRHRLAVTLVRVDLGKLTFSQGIAPSPSVPAVDSTKPDSTKADSAKADSGKPDSTSARGDSTSSDHQAAPRASPRV